MAMISKPKTQRNNANSFRERLEAISEPTTTGQRVWRASRLMRFLRIFDPRILDEALTEAKEMCESPDQHIIFVKYDDGYDDYYLSRLACYLVCMRCPGSPVVREAAIYFANGVCDNEIREKIEHIYDNNDGRLHTKDAFDHTTTKLTRCIKGHGARDKDVPRVMGVGNNDFLGMTQEDLKKKHGIDPKDDYFDYAPASILHFIAGIREATADEIEFEDIRDIYEMMEVHSKQAISLRAFLDVAKPYFIENAKVSNVKITDLQKEISDLKGQIRDNAASVAVSEETIRQIPFMLPGME